MNRQAAILIPYYGKWPGYMDLYLKSCSMNPILDIIFVTDLDPISNAPPTIKYIHLGIDDLIRKIGSVVQFDIPAIKPYKFCDFRPLYGAIFQEELKNYAFWGYGDIDLIYGDLGKYLTETAFKDHDIIAFRNDHLHGPFTLYRNVHYVNDLYKKCESLQKILTDKEYLSFDEFGVQAYHVSADREIDNYRNDSISVIALKESKKGNLKLFMKPYSKEVISESKEIIVFDNGKLYEQKTNNEFAFYHWVIEKRALWFKYPEWQVIPDKFYVSETGFYTESQFRNYLMLHLYRKLAGTIQWTWLKCVNFLKRRVGIKVTLDTYPKLGFVKAI